jgi:hypothetical protein
MKMATLRFDPILSVLIPLLLLCFGLSLSAQAVSPPPDGGYSGANTAEGNGALLHLTTGTNNTAVGSEALLNVNSASQNTAVGAQTLKNNVFQNTAVGFQALTRNDANGNTATGWRALFSNTTASGNTADGYGALYTNIDGSQNTAVGNSALYNNLHGSRNTALGNQANYLVGGNDNTAVGNGALASSAFSGSDGNTALGSIALALNTTGSSNTATGFFALASNTTGSNNTANGVFALGSSDVPIGSNNTAMGAGAIMSSHAASGLDNNTAVGAQALPLPLGGQNNIAIGYAAGANLAGPGPTNNIEIGNPGDLNDVDTTRIGDVQKRAFVAGIYGTTTGNTTTLPVIVDSNGQLGTAASSERFKTEIKPMGETSEGIMALKPVTFHYKSDKTGTPQFGLVAEEVAKVNPDLVVRDKNGEIYTVRYDAVNAMLLNEFVKEHRKVNELESTVARLATRLEEQDSKIAKISDQLEMSRSSSRVAASQ